MIEVVVKDGPGDASGIAAWTETVEDPRAALAEVASIMRADIQERWDSESDPWGGSWAPRSITTLEIRDAQDKDPTPRSFPAAARVTEEGKATRIGFASSLPRYFHEGNAANLVFGKGRGPRPARPVLPLRGGRLDLPSDLRDALMAAFREEIRAEIRRRTSG